MAYLKTPFFQYGLELITHKTGTIDDKDGVVSIEIKNLGYEYSFQIPIVDFKEIRQAAFI